ncbi:hypothetical protein ACFOY4_23270 [Actinomadura syzygii]|uniref:Uncharacterized protein n=1 Tax=Actinomadura syzygii TaxID=1427538 RepID=A0A5D0UJE1_9ACTN|nr:hypothetical protein [Actinomadura syzygii]TYC18631.1 hypothetical protein FXF65_02435 [Actinomadura syzygii]
MKSSRKTAATLGLAAIGITSAVAMTPANAAAGPGAVTVRPGAHGAYTVHVTRASGAAALAAPSTSPSVDHRFVPDGGSFTCARSYACAVVPYSNGAYVFNFYRYGGYSLSYWHGNGAFVNNQTDGAAARYDDANGHQVGCVPAGIARNGIDWNPIWRIRLTAAAC